jgi:hypothetical protein
LDGSIKNPIMQQLIQNDPTVSPMLRQYLETMANNPAMLGQVAQQMQDPALRAQLHSIMASGDSATRGFGMPRGVGGYEMPGGGGGGVGAPSNVNNSNNASSAGQQSNDQDQTEEEMIAEAIRRSLEET